MIIFKIFLKYLFKKNIKSYFLFISYVLKNRQFIQSYPSLKFVGLALTNVNSLDIFQKSSAPLSPTQLHISSSSSAISSLAKNPAQYTQNFNAAKFLQLKQQNSFDSARKNDLIVNF